MNQMVRKKSLEGSGNLEIRINGKTRFQLSSESDGVKVVERAPIGYSVFLQKGEEPNTANMLNWVAGFRNKWESFSLRGLVKGSRYDVIIAPEKKLIAYNAFEDEENIQSWKKARTNLEKMGYEFHKYKNVRAWEKAKGPVEERYFIGAGN
jgi:hypothetical protein